MRPIRALSLLFVVILVILASCSTLSKADSYLIANATPREKSDFLLRKATALYENVVLTQKDYKALAMVRDLLANADTQDPTNDAVDAYSQKVDAYLSKQLGDTKSKADALKAKANPSDKDNYDLLVAVKQMNDLAPTDSATVALTKQTGDLKNKTIAKRITLISDSQKKLEKETARATITSLIAQTTQAADEVLYIDPTNKAANDAKAKLDGVVQKLVAADLTKVQDSLKANDYPGASAAIGRINQTYSSLSMKPDASFLSLVYQTNYRWAQSLFNQKKWSDADDKVDLAIAANRTSEAVALKRQIAQGAANIDYDAQIDSLLSAVDARINAGDLAGAWASLDSLNPKVKQQASKNKIAAKRAVIQQKMQDLYTKAVTAYGAEDFKTAQDSLTIIIAIDPNYQQAKAYLDRASAKLKALGGN